MLFPAVESALLEVCFLVTIFLLRDFTCWSFLISLLSIPARLWWNFTNAPSLLCFLTYRADVILKFLIGRNIGPHIVSSSRRACALV